MRTRHLWLSGLVTACLALAACAGVTMLYSGYVATAYTTTEFGRGAGRKDLKVEVRGDPFTMDQQEFDVAVVEVLKRHQPRPQPTNFTLDPGPSANSAFRVLLLFDAPAAVNPLSACRVGPPVVEPQPDLVRVSAMFCRNQGTLTKVTGEVSGVTSVDDPGFNNLMSQVVIALFPIRDQGRNNRRLRIAP